MASAVSIARWLLSEASSGTTPTECADDESTNTLTIDYSSGDAEWTSIAAGNGLDFTASPATNGTAIAELADISTNGDIGSSLDGASGASCIFVIDLDSGHNNGARAFHIGTNSGNGDFGITFDGSDRLEVRWDYEDTSNNFHRYPAPSISGDVVIAVIVDTTEGAEADRSKVYYDNVLQTRATSDTIAQNSTLSNVDSTNRSVCLGNRPSQNRNIDGALYYFELFTGQLTTTEVEDSYDALILDNDSNWATGGGETVPVPVGSISLAGQTPTILTTDDKSIEIPVGAISLSGQVPTIQTGLDVDVPIPAGSITLAGQAPIVLNNVNVSIPVGAISLSGQVPAIQTGGNLSIEIPVGSISLNGLVPAIEASDDKSVIIPVGSITLSGQVPTVQATNNIDVTIPVGAVLLAGFAPIANVTDNKQIEVPTGSISLSGQVPTAALGPLTIVVPVGAITLSGLVPTIISVVSPDSFVSVIGRIDETGTDSIGFITAKGSSAIGNIDDVVSTSGKIDDGTVTGSGRIDKTGNSVLGEL